MKNYKYNKYIKVGFLICIILTIALFFYINNIIQEQLEEDKNQLKKDISLQITSIIDNYSREYISFNPQKMQEMYNVIDLLEITVIIKSSVKGESGETCELFNIDLDNKGKCTDEVNQRLSIMKTHFVTIFQPKSTKKAKTCWVLNIANVAPSGLIWPKWPQFAQN